MQGRQVSVKHHQPQQGMPDLAQQHNAAALRAAAYAQQSQAQPGAVPLPQGAPQQLPPVAQLPQQNVVQQFPMPMQAPFDPSQYQQPPQQYQPPAPAVGLIGQALGIQTTMVGGQAGGHMFQLPDERWIRFGPPGGFYTTTLFDIAGDHSSSIAVVAMIKACMFVRGINEVQRTPMRSWQEFLLLAAEIGDDNMALLIAMMSDLYPGPLDSDLERMRKSLRKL